MSRKRDRSHHAATLSGLVQSAEALRLSGQTCDAERAFRAVLAIEAAHAGALGSLGLLLNDAGRHQEAVTYLAAAAKAAPGRAALWSNLGMGLAALNRHHDALTAYDRALILAPREPAIHANRGNTLKSLGNPESALASFNRALALDPDHTGTLVSRGTLRLDNNRLDEAIADFDRALAINPELATARNNRGNAYTKLSRYADAAIDFEKAAWLVPGDATILNNLGTTLHNLRRHADAVAVLEAAIAIRPDYASAHWNLGLVLLDMGDFRRGWAEYEWRWATPFFAQQRRVFAAPQWYGESLGRGENLAGKVVFIHAEQGFGDTLQFIRYAPLLAGLGARVRVEVPAELERLASRVDGIESITLRGDPVPPCDFHCPTMSLPLAFGTDIATIPAPVAYLTAPPDAVASWSDWLAGISGPRIGLTWSGRPTHSNDANRSMPFAALASLFARTNARFISLQTEFRPTDAAAVAAEPDLLCAPRPFTDFADTAGLIAGLDLVITIDTSIAHLAGALGKPVFILLPFNNDFRWMIGRQDCPWYQDSPWYPTARLFRQTKAGDWTAVAERAAQALGEAFPTCTPKP